MEIKRIVKIAGKIGAGLLGLGGLILAGKSGFGENLGCGAAETAGNLEDTLVDLDAETSSVPEETPFEPDPAEEEETSE